MMLEEGRQTMGPTLSTTCQPVPQDLLDRAEALRGELVGFAYRRTGNREDAWDCVQELYRRFAKCWAQVRIDLKGWLYATLRSCLRDWYETRRNRSLPALEDPGGTLAAAVSPVPEQVARVLDGDRAALLERKALSLIPNPGIRETFRLWAVEGRDYRTIAGLQGIKENAVRKRIFLAQTRLRADLPRLEFWEEQTRLNIHYTQQSALDPDWPVVTVDTMFAATQYGCWNDDHPLISRLYRATVDIHDAFRRRYGEDAIGFIKAAFVDRSSLTEAGIENIRRTLKQRVRDHLPTLPLYRRANEGVIGLDDLGNGTCVLGHLYGFGENLRDELAEHYLSTLHDRLSRREQTEACIDAELDQSLLYHWPPGIVRRGSRVYDLAVDRIRALLHDESRMVIPNLLTKVRMNDRQYTFRGLVTGEADVDAACGELNARLQGPSRRRHQGR